MAGSPRAHKLADLIQQEVSDIIRFSIKNPEIQSMFITVTSVDVTRDLSQAKIYVSEINQKNDEMVAALNSAASFIRRELAPRLTVRHIPTLSFFYDDSMEKGRKISELLSGKK